MAILHVFNPEHDLALAANLSNFTAPHAGRKLRADLAYLPAIWAEADDYILVNHVAQAVKGYGRLRARIGGGQRQFVDKHQLANLPIDKVEVWGWDLALRAFLLRYGVTAVPTEEAIGAIRALSHRKTAVTLLPQLQTAGTTGASRCVQTVAAVQEDLNAYGRLVVKAPWSSSGRGVRFVDAAHGIAGIERWLHNVIERQGCVVVEPHYNKVKDFGMEFESDGAGGIRYLGLSAFQTKNGAYTGNIIATEREKLEMIGRYVPEALLDEVRMGICRLLGSVFGGNYRGAFGVDMMVVSAPGGDGFLLHPCVEINLRRTMGHVALAIPPFADGFPRVMSIVLTDKYRIQIRKR